MGWILLAILALLILGGLPRWNYSRNWGYGPSGALGLVLVVVVVLVYLGAHSPRLLMREHYEQPGFSIGALEYEGVPAYVSPAPPVAAREGADRNPELRSRCGTRRRGVLTAFVANDEELRA